jgi:hypothetical protein
VEKLLTNQLSLIIFFYCDSLKTNKFNLKLGKEEAMKSNKKEKRDDFIMRLFKKFWKRVVSANNDGSTQAGKIDPREGRVYIK